MSHSGAPVATNTLATANDDLEFEILVVRRAGVPRARAGVVGGFVVPAARQRDGGERGVAWAPHGACPGSSTASSRASVRGAFGGVEELLVPPSAPSRDGRERQTHERLAPGGRPARVGRELHRRSRC